LIRKKKVPLRMCVGCRERKRKMDLIRVVRTPDGEIKIDATGKLSGRGAYLCPSSEECLKKAVKSNALERALETQISDEIFDRLKSDVNHAVQD